MGFALHWAALKGGNLESICSVFKLRPTGRREEIPESDIVGVELPTGWSLVLFHRKTIKERHLEELSKFGEVVSCFVEEHVMFSTASGWKYGGVTWSAIHDCNKGLSHLEVEGPAPPAIDETRQRLLAAQNAGGGEKAEVDYLFDAPVEIARQLTGFRHDQDVPGMTGEVFHVLEPAKESRLSTGAGGLFSRLFGKQGQQ
jgi:hypothetical protein